MTNRTAWSYQQGGQAVETDRKSLLAVLKQGINIQNTKRTTKQNKKQLLINKRAIELIVLKRRNSNGQYMFLKVFNIQPSRKCKL